MAYKFAYIYAVLIILLMKVKTKSIGISLPSDLYEHLENKRGMISRSRFYRELIVVGMNQKRIGREHAD